MVEPDMRDPALEAGLQLIQHGTPDLALEAAKSLGFNAASSMPGPGCLEPDGTIRAVLKVFDTANLSLDDVMELEESFMMLLDARPRLAAQMVAACADPDPRIAFAALVVSRRLFANVDISRRMLKAGAVPAVMSALKHSNAGCRAAAATAAAPRVFDIGMNASRTARMVGTARIALRAFLEAGLVPALVDLIRAGRSQNVPPASPGVFSNIEVEMAMESHMVVLPNFEPALRACDTIQLLARPEVSGSTIGGLTPSEAQQVIADVVKAGDAAAALVQCLKQYDGELQEPPAKLICAVLKSLAGEGSRLEAARVKLFCKKLVEAGLPDLLPSLIRPEQAGITGYVLLFLKKILEVLGVGCLPSDGLPEIAAACAECIEMGGDNANMHQRDVRMNARSCLERISKGLRRDVSRPVPQSQEDRVARASAIGEGPKAQRDPDTAGKGRNQRLTCIQCGKSGGDGVRLQSCSRCQMAVYCGRACQRSHWPHHKAECTAKAAAAQEPS